MDERLVKAARVGDDTTLHNLMEADPEILERASLNHFTDSALHVAALYGKADFVRYIMTLMPSLAKETNQQGMIPLHLASLKGHVEIVRVLLKAKLDDDGVNQCLLKDDQGRTALHCASQKGKISVIKELIRECPKCLEQVTAKGETVLHIAVKANQFAAVKLLADSIREHSFHNLLKAQDQKGKSAYQLAEAKEQLQVAEALKEDNDEKGDITEEGCTNRDGEGSDSEASEKKETNNSRQFEDAVLVVATLIATLSYQAMANPPSTFLKEGNTRMDWSCLSKGSHGLIKRLKDCPALLALLFMIFDSLVFFHSIVVVLFAIRGSSAAALQLLAVNLVSCYCLLLMAFYYNAVYFALPCAYLALTFGIFIYYWSRDTPMSRLTGPFKGIVEIDPTKGKIKVFGRFDVPIMRENFARRIQQQLQQKQ